MNPDARVVIIGAGITGGCIARELSRYHLDVHLVEQHGDIGWGATKANTGIIHPGHEEDPTRHPLRALLCRQGNKRWQHWTRELDIPARWPGELMVAQDTTDRKTLKHYCHLGEHNQVDGLRIVEGEEMQELEPLLHTDTVAALWAPSAGIIAPWEAVLGVVENAQANNVQIHLDSEVIDVETNGNTVTGLQTSQGRIAANVVINAAGLQAGHVAEMASIHEPALTPRRGEYILFDEDANIHPERIVHPVPTKQTKGVYAVTTIEGNLMLGPTAEDLPPDAIHDRATTREGVSFIWNNAARLLRQLPSHQAIVKTFAGLRPEPPDGRYIIKAYDDPWGFINAAGIRSPGLTAAPAIAAYVAGILHTQLDIELQEKQTWQPQRHRITHPASLPQKQQQRHIQQQPSYGRVVCRCKEVTEAEIIEAIQRIRRLGGTVSLDGVKFRTLAMFGFCQGSFCRTHIARIIARELDVPLWKVNEREAASYLAGDIKSLQEDQP